MSLDTGEICSWDDGPSLDEALAAIRDVEVSLWTPCNAPAVITRQFTDIPEDGMIAIVTEKNERNRQEELEGIFLLSTPWKLLQRVALREKAVALLLIPDDSAVAEQSSPRNECAERTLHNE